MSNVPFNPPAYGQLNESLLAWLKQHPVPNGFRVQNKLADESTFLAWIDSIADQIAEVLWPRFVPGPEASWKGKAVETAKTLTQADFQLMSDLKKMLVLAPNGRSGSQRTHKFQFVVEDVGDQWGTYADYDNEIPADLLAMIKQTMAAASVNVRSTAIVFKQMLQRPRAYQMASNLGIADFTYEEALSAATPSMLSGHSIQGLMAAATAFITHRRALDDIAESVRYLQQWGVDHGDRRTFAGVHYPSDNIASWFVLLNACDNFLFGYHGQDARDFMWQAISLRSTTFSAMKSAGGVYAAPLAMLEAVAMSKVKY